MARERSSSLADSAVKNKFYAVGYIVSVFFLIPGALIAASNYFDR